MSYANQLEPVVHHDKQPTSFAALAKEEKIMYEPGDTVRVRQLGDDAPRMVVKEAVKGPHPTEPSYTRLLGIRCFWYGPHGNYYESLFNTKDLTRLVKSRQE